MNPCWYGLFFGLGLAAFVTIVTWFQTRRDMKKDGTWDAYKNNRYSN